MLILGGGGRLTLNLERIHRDFGRITSDNVDPWGVNQHSTWKGSAETLEGSPLTMFILGGQLTLNLERICRDLGRITSDNVHPGGGRLTLNLERIHRDFGRITSDNVHPGGSIDTQLGKDPQRLWKDSPLTMFILGGGFNQHSTWKGSAETLEGLPLTMFILGVGVDRHSTWKGSTETLEGLPLTMLILGGQSTLNLERICRDFGRILGGSIDTQLGQCQRPWKDSPLTMFILGGRGGSIDTQLGKDLQRLWKDHL